MNKNGYTARGIHPSLSLEAGSFLDDPVFQIPENMCLDLQRQYFAFRKLKSMSLSKYVYIYIYGFILMYTLVFQNPPVIQGGPKNEL